MPFSLSNNGLGLSTHNLIDIWLPDDHVNPWDQYLKSDVPRILMYEKKDIANNYRWDNLTQIGVDENGYPSFQQETVPEVGSEFLWRTTIEKGVSLKFTEGYYVFGIRKITTDAPTVYVSIDNDSHVYPFLAYGACPGTEVKIFRDSSVSNNVYWFFGGIRIA